MHFFIKLINHNQKSVKLIHFNIKCVIDKKRYKAINTYKDDVIIFHDFQY